MDQIQVCYLLQLIFTQKGDWYPCHSYPKAKQCPEVPKTSTNVHRQLITKEYREQESRGQGEKSIIYNSVNIQSKLIRSYTTGEETTTRYTELMKS